MVSIKLGAELLKLDEISMKPCGKHPDAYVWQSDDRLEGADLKKNLNAICFDADGVVVYPQMQFAKYLEKQHGITQEITRSFFWGVFNDCLVGKADLREVLPAYLNDWNWKGSVDQFVATWLERDHVVDDRLIFAIRSRVFYVVLPQARNGTGQNI